MSIAGLSIGIGSVRRARRSLVAQYFACLQEMTLLEQNHAAPGAIAEIHKLAEERRRYEDELTREERDRVHAAYSRWYYRFIA